MRLFKTPVIVRQVQTLTDKGCKLSVVTPELAPAEMALLFALRGVEAWMLLSPTDNMTEADVPDAPAKVEANEKTPSQRLRGVLYRLWEGTGQTMPFELYYKIKTDAVIDRFKQELDS